MASPLEAKVARVIDSRTLVLNKGSAGGVEVGMRFKVLNRNGAMIEDPETHEVLGSVAIEKVVVKVTEVQSKLSVAMTFRVIEGRPGLFSAMTTTEQITGTRDKIETLKAEGQTAKQELSASESLVKVGDTAVQVVGE